MQRDVDLPARRQVDEASLRSGGLDEEKRVHPPAEAFERRLEEGLGGRNPMGRRRERDAGDLAGPSRLQVVPAVEHQHGGAGQRPRIDPVGKPAPNEVRRGGRDIAQAAERHRPAALDRGAVGRHRGQDLAAAQPVDRVFLPVEHQIEQRARALGETRHRRHEPGAEAVPVHRHANAGRARVDAATGERRQVPRHLAFEQAHPLDMGADPRADFGRRAGLAAHDEDGAQALLQRPDPLGYRRGGDAEGAGGTLEAAFADDGRDCGQGGVIEH
ncbi:hypothetical protein QO011_008098 [Labrys wisconsinensis]|uniref:Uncharacterized protein n=1 Tax=Labrys wisconsinensis TaxID=425677 RepID=A0ABU0JL86_9HYPH|nr:hypothetical protein [Labrys wisconsinensis]